MQTYFSTTESPFFTADFHYFRLAREKWEMILTRFIQLGLNTITITVPWGFHEISKGHVDFTGATNTRRDLVGFIELCAALDFYCILKPGPYSPDNNILVDGLPVWLSPESSDFDEAVESWYQAIGKALTPYQWPHGPIIALYLDDQPVPDETPTYSEEITEVRWPIWLRKRYRGMDTLNEMYGTDYRSVNDVPFSPTSGDSPLEKDTAAFLAEMLGDEASNQDNPLVEAGWQIPVYETENIDLPAMQNHSALLSEDYFTWELNDAILNLQHLIQVDPDPTDIGTGPVWANGAPIRSDGSVRHRFWEIRQFLWAQQNSNIQLDSHTLHRSFVDGGMVTAKQNTALKIPLEKGSKPGLYSLALSGEVLPASTLKAARARLSGPYAQEFGDTQTDLILYLNDPTTLLVDFPLTYLSSLLKAKAQTLAHCAQLVQALAESLHPDQTQPESDPQPAKKPTSYTIAEARRGLSEADRVLRKAMSSIGGLEAGFETMLGKSSRYEPEPVTPSLALSPEIFEGTARDIVLKVGKVCRAMAPKLAETSQTLQNTVQPEVGFTIKQYQHSYAQALGAAEDIRLDLLTIIAELRLEITTEQLPLVMWRIHNQVQDIAESLRWGVLGR